MVLFSCGEQKNNNELQDQVFQVTVVDLMQEVQPEPPTEMFDFADWENFFE